MNQFVHKGCFYGLSAQVFILYESNYLLPYEISILHVEET